MREEFVHLHNHSQYSVLDAVSSVQAIAARAAADGMPAVALTDHGNLYGAIDFYKECKDVKVKPILGCELYLAPESRLDRGRDKGGKVAYHLLVLAMGEKGYHNLCKLSSIGFTEGFYYFPRIDWETLEKYSEDLICLSGCMGAEIGQSLLNTSEEEAFRVLERYHSLFGDRFYLELQRHAMTEEQIEQDGIHKEAWLEQSHREFIQKQNKMERFLVEAARKYSIPLVATNDCHYIKRDDWKGHEILLNIQSGEPCEIWENDSLGNPKYRKPNPKRRTYNSHEMYFKSTEEMYTLFADLPEAVENTAKIASRCNLKLDFETRHYPSYLPPTIEGKKVSKGEQKKAVEGFLRQLCEEGIAKRYTPERLAKVQECFPDQDPMDVVRSRLETELSIIIPKGMSDYLLIVWDFIHWAKTSGIPVGPGRGSGAGSIVLYLIGVTDIEPLRFHLFFERFINPERISYPDIDVDICMEGRGKVIEYTLHKYGRENVAQIITFGTMKAKMVIRDVGRVLNVSLSKVNDICKLVPDDLNITIEKALEKDHELAELVRDDEETRRIIEIGRNLEGCIRNTGIHAAGIVVSGEPLTEHIPICLAKDSEMPATQYSMKPVEKVGMLKIDFLGLKTLTSIQIAVEEIEKNWGIAIDWVNLPLEDEKTFQLLNQGKTMGVFQLESAGMQDLARNLHLDRFEEIIAVGALYRPGPMDMIPSFINRKHGREPIEYDHPLMEKILAETYGIMVYQEQVMQIAQTLAGYSLGEGDVLRRAMGKKDHSEMEKQREKFRKGAIAKGIENQVATEIFDKIEKFASYGFNKSHSAAYGYIAYVTAYLKANYTKEWLAALMTSDRDDTAKVSKFIREAKALGIPVLPPDVNESGENFAATKNGIRFAMSGIKGVGGGVVEAVVEERKKGPYTSLYDFIRRINTKKVGKKTVELLVEAGCFDFTSWSRDSLKLSVEPMYDSVSKKQKDVALGYMSLFDQVETNDDNRFQTPPEVLAPTSKRDLLFKEKELLGFFLTGHPMDEYKNILQRLSCIPLRKIHELENNTLFRSAILVETVGVRFSKKSQKKFAILTISDGMVSYELPIWSEQYERDGPLLNENQLLYAVLGVEQSEGEVRLSCRWLGDLTAADEEMIAACDRAFDQAKHSIHKKQYAMQKKQEKPSKAPEETLELTVDADRFGHAAILELKELFAAHRGKSKVRLHFQAGEKSIALISIDDPWGVAVSDSLKKKVVAISGVTIP